MRLEVGYIVVKDVGLNTYIYCLVRQSGTLLVEAGGLLHFCRGWKPGTFFVEAGGLVHG